MPSRCPRHCAPRSSARAHGWGWSSSSSRRWKAARRQELADGKQPLVAQLIRLRAIGPKGAWMLVKELFGWRRFANRRELAGCLGLAPTPYASGDSQIEQGISKAGNRRVAPCWWSCLGWLRLQPDSALTQWFNRRFAAAGKRSVV